MNLKIHVKFEFSFTFEVSGVNNLQLFNKLIDYLCIIKRVLLMLDFIDDIVEFGINDDFGVTFLIRLLKICLYVSRRF